MDVSILVPVCHFSGILTIEKSLTGSEREQLADPISLLYIFKYPAGSPKQEGYLESYKGSRGVFRFHTRQAYGSGVGTGVGTNVVQTTIVRRFGTKREARAEKLSPPLACICRAV